MQRRAAAVASARSTASPAASWTAKKSNAVDDHAGHAERGRAVGDVVGGRPTSSTTSPRRSRCSRRRRSPEGSAAVRRSRPAGLTERQVQVLRLMAAACRTGPSGPSWSISPRTAEHHVQDVYARIGVSSRAAAALFAMEHGLLAEDGRSTPGAPTSRGRDAPRTPIRGGRDATTRRSCGASSTSIKPAATRSCCARRSRSAAGEPHPDDRRPARRRCGGRRHLRHVPRRVRGLRGRGAPAVRRLRQGDDLQDVHRHPHRRVPGHPADRSLRA